jgi:hypothetical protein
MINHAISRAALISALISCVAFSPAFAQRKAIGVQRDSHGRIARSSKAKSAFKKQTGFPHGRPGYVIDHIVPLAKGGSDSPGNMQWQTSAEAKAKDRVERGGSSRVTYRSRSYSRKSYAPRHRSPGARTYRTPSIRSHSYRRSSHRRR